MLRGDDQCLQCSVTRSLEVASTSVSTWMADHQGRPRALLTRVRSSVWTRFNPWPNVQILVIEVTLTRMWNQYEIRWTNTKSQKKANHWDRWTGRATVQWLHRTVGRTASGTYMYTLNQYILPHCLYNNATYMNIKTGEVYIHGRHAWCRSVQSTRYEIWNALWTSPR